MAHVGLGEVEHHIGDVGRAGVGAGHRGLEGDLVAGDAVGLGPGRRGGQRDLRDVVLGEGLQLARVRDAVLVQVLPDPERAEVRVGRVDDLVE